MFLMLTEILRTDAPEWRQLTFSLKVFLIHSLLALLGTNFKINVWTSLSLDQLMIDRSLTNVN